MYAQWGPPPPGYRATLRVDDLPGNGPLGISNRAPRPNRTHSGARTLRGNRPVSPKICRVPSWVAEAISASSWRAESIRARVLARAHSEKLDGGFCMSFLPGSLG